MAVFIALEGGEGVGKSTQIRKLKESAETLFPGRPFTFTREPGGTPFADEIRALILGGSAKEADGFTLFGLFVAARAEHITQVIRPALEQGNIVLSDRFVAATYAYQVYAQEGGIPEELFAAYVKALPLRPQLTIILDADPLVGIERSRGRRTDENNHFDERDALFHKKVREGYSHFMQRYADNQHQVVLVDASGDIEDVHTKVLSYIRPLAMAA